MSQSALAAVFLLVATAGTAACQGTPPSAQPSPVAGASVRDTDFRNFRYAFGEASWTLVDGTQPDAGEEELRYELDAVTYGDVTGDGREEALVTITAETGGTMVPHWIFVYGAGARGPELLWSFESGDRAAGGLKRVYAEGGMLVVELLGKGKVPHDPATYGAEDDTAQGACCPGMFTRSRYTWTGRAFVPRGEPQVLPYDPDAE
ncbi:MAG TPA: hypothetical protein VEQ60_04925 [Longimicrobium sp.]|nr:hypothetical protein [Longimicrobium sp.]